MKYAFLMMLSFPAFATSPTYSLEEICQTYGRFGKCGTVEFCQETQFARGCFLAQGAPSFVEGLCKLQTEKWGCDLMQQQGNCVWVENSTSTCHAKREQL